MSMSTVYVLIRDGQLVQVSESVSAEASLEQFKNYGEHGEVFAARMSDYAAFLVRGTLHSKQVNIATKQLKAYAHSLMKVGDA